MEFIRIYTCTPVVVNVQFMYFFSFKVSLSITDPAYIMDALVYILKRIHRGHTRINNI